jgi:hypothetical protein
VDAKKIVVAIIIIVCSIVLMFAAVGNSQQHANGANVESNSTSTTCIDDKPCVTTICINNEPCRTITSNSTTTGNLTDNNKNPVTSPFFQPAI